MVSYDEFEEWAEETFDTRNSDTRSGDQELVVYRDGTLAALPGEPMEQTMTAEDLYELVEDRVADYDTVAEISADDFKSRVNELHLSYWQDQGYVDAVGE